MTACHCLCKHKTTSSMSKVLFDSRLQVYPMETMLPVGMHPGQLEHTWSGLMAIACMDCSLGFKPACCRASCTDKPSCPCCKSRFEGCSSIPATALLPRRVVENLQTKASVKTNCFDLPDLPNKLGFVSAPQTASEVCASATKQDAWCYLQRGCLFVAFGKHGSKQQQQSSAWRLVAVFSASERSL